MKNDVTLYNKETGEIMMEAKTLEHTELTAVKATDGTVAMVRKEELERVKNEAEEMEPVEYELIFSKYPTVESFAFKQKRLEDYVAWQRDMLRVYTDSHLADTAALSGVDIYCIENDFDMKKKGKGKLKAKFVIKQGKEVIDVQRLVLNKVRESDVHRIIDAHIFLLEMGLFGNTCDYKNEEGPLHKFCATIKRPDLLKSTLELLNAIEEMKTDGGIVEKKGE